MMHDRTLGYADREAVDRKWEKTRAAADLVAWWRRDAADRSSGAQWFVVRLHGRDANRVAASMACHGIEAWCPMEKIVQRRPRSRGCRTVERPLFDGYLFVHVAAAESCWLGVMTFEGVACFLGNGEKPSHVRDETIQQIRDFLELPEAQRKFLFRRGDRVVVARGPFGSFEATVLASEDRQGGVRLEVDIFGRMTPCTIGLDDLKKLG